MSYLVKLTRTNGSNKIVEKAGLRGMRTLVSIENENRKKTFKMHKLEGWSTIKGAQKYIEQDQKYFAESDWKTDYDIIIKL